MNYRIAFEKQLFRFRNAITMQADAAAQLGTLFTNASVGVNTAIGFLDDAFKSKTGKTKLSMYIYTRPMFNMVGYDATLQGGLFNRKRPYTIESAAIERFTARVDPQGRHLIS